MSGISQRVPVCMIRFFRSSSWSVLQNLPSENYTPGQVSGAISPSWRNSVLSISIYYTFNTRFLAYAWYAWCCEHVFCQVETFAPWTLHHSLPASWDLESQLLECDQLSFAKNWGCIDLPISGLLPSKMVQKKCKEQILWSELVLIVLVTPSETIKLLACLLKDAIPQSTAVFFLEQQKRWFGIVRSSQHPNKLCTDVMHHVQVMELYPHISRLYPIRSCTIRWFFKTYLHSFISTDFASNACLAYIHTYRYIVISKRRRSNPLSVLQRWGYHLLHLRGHWTCCPKRPMVCVKAQASCFRGKIPILYE